MCNITMGKKKESIKILKKCSLNERVKFVESILKDNKKPMKPKEILSEVNIRMSENGYEPVKELYMSRIKKISKVIDSDGTNYSYSVSREKMLERREELKSMLEHFNSLTLMSKCTPIILCVDNGYEKIICDLMYKLFKRKSIYCFEGVGCVLMAVEDPSVLKSEVFRDIKTTLDEFNKQNQDDT